MSDDVYVRDTEFYCEYSFLNWLTDLIWFTETLFVLWSCLARSLITVKLIEDHFSYFLKPVPMPKKLETNFPKYKIYAYKEGKKDNKFRWAFKITLIL